MGLELPNASKVYDDVTHVYDDVTHVQLMGVELPNAKLLRLLRLGRVIRLFRSLSLCVCVCVSLSLL
jgi:hypothetical protein